MSAVIWCGIVAVWVFVLIPTWVRRGDIHWRGSTASGAMRALSGSRSTRSTAAGPADDAAGEAADERGRWSRMTGLRLRGRSRSDEPSEVDAMDEHDESHEPEWVAPASRERVAAAPASQRLSSAMNSVSTGLKGARAARSEREKPPLRVRRARRLLALAALTVVTLVAAVALRGLWIPVTVLSLVALVLYMRHLRRIARDQRARAQRERRARAARQAWDAASGTERAQQIDGWSASAPLTADERYAFDEQMAVTQQIDLTGYDETSYDEPAAQQESLYDQHAEPVAEHRVAEHQDDAPTEELLAAKAS